MILWLCAALMWLPWFALVLRYLLDIALGADPRYSDFLKPAFVGLWPKVGFGIWPPVQLLYWKVVSWFPVTAVLAMAVVLLGWRIYYIERGFLLTRTRGWLLLSTLVPPVAPFLAWFDARLWHDAREEELEAEVQDARERLGLDN
jgi:hypothetical protein